MNYQESLQFINSYVPDTNKHKFTADWGLSRMRYLLTLLGNPQEQFKAIHIAGTSGKTSTAYYTHAFMMSQGFRTGLTISPHILNIRERVQINSTWISEEDFAKNLTEMQSIIHTVASSEFGKPTYFEIMMALAFYSFAKENVGYAVIETGLGGLFDGSNTIMRKDKICIITRLGFDHMAVLGNTLPEIAFQKAGIIHPHNTVVMLSQKQEAQEVIEKKVAEVDATLHPVTHGKTFSNVTIQQDKTIFDYTFADIPIPSFEIAEIGLNQAENASLALSAVICACKNEKKNIDIASIRHAGMTASFKARFDIVPIKDKLLIIDGAHNPQKMHSLADNLMAVFPNQKFIFLISLKHIQKFEAMLRYIIPFAEEIVFTSLSEGNMQDIHNTSEKADKAIAQIEKLHFTKYRVILDQTDAFLAVVSESKFNIVATGSLYFASDVYALVSRFMAASMNTLNNG